MSWEIILKREALKVPQLKQAILNVTQNLERFIIDDIIEDLRIEYARLLAEEGIMTPANAKLHSTRKIKLDGGGSLSRYFNSMLRGIFTNRKSRAAGGYTIYYEREE